MATVQQLQVD